VYRCELCDRWFCEKHLKPRLAFIKDLNAIDKIPEIRALYYTEIEGKEGQGHPDFQYSQKRLEELDIEEKIRFELIDRALNGENFSRCPKCGSWYSLYEEANYCQKCGFELGKTSQAVAVPKPSMKGFSWHRTEEPQAEGKEEIPKKDYLPEARDLPTYERPKTKPRRSIPIKKIVGASMVLVILGVFLWYGPTIISMLQNLLQNNPFSPRNYSHEELVDYTLSLINSDRNGYSVNPNGTIVMRVLKIGEKYPQNVSLSSIGSAQQHADDMLKNHYVSHWDTQGYKPYMRYTLAGGQGSVSENVAWVQYSFLSDPKEAIAKLEFDMVNDDAEWNWGHRDNIIESSHNKVNIGIAYDSNNLYLVEDFEDDYVTWSTFTVTQNQVTLVGSLSQQVSLSQVSIFYDSLPSNLTAHQLDNSPYDGSYTQGTFAGMALPPNYQSQQGITITAQTWVQSTLAFQIKFDLSQVFNAYGKGVYTIYLQTTTQDSLTTYSIWHD